MFDYIGSDLNTVVAHVKTASRQAVSAARTYHVERGGVDVVEKIDKARQIAKRDSAAERVRLMSEALDE